jgi:hypothetical protein
MVAYVGLCQVMNHERGRGEDRVGFRQVHIMMTMHWRAFPFTALPNFNANANNKALANLQTKMKESCRDGLHENKN